MPTYMPLVNEYRGELLDVIHLGYVCAVDEKSNVIFSVGSPDEKVFYRSASKPFQALPVISRGLDREYGITEEESVIFAGSHMGDTFHVEALESIHRKAGLSEDMLVMNPSFPQIAHDPNIAKRKFYHNCSGKHTGAMLLQRALGGEVRDYWKVDSLAQKEIKRCVAIMAEVDEDDIIVGLDGCGVPVFAVPMKNMAISAKNLAYPDAVRDDEMREAAKIFMPRIHKYPYMMRGKDMLCSLINFDPNIVAKGGANGAYGLGLKKERIGVSIKMIDGAGAVWPFVIAAILKKLNYKNDETYAMLEKQCPTVIYNDNLTPCGHRETAF